MRSRQLDIALAMGEGGVLVPLVELRRRCLEAHCHNEPNFARNMRTSSLFDEIRDGKRIVGWRLAGANPASSGGASPTDCLIPRSTAPAEMDQPEEDEDRLLVRLVEEENANLRAAEALRIREIETLRAEAESAKARLALLESQTASRVISGPRSVIECVELVESLFDDRVVFTDRARETAKRARINELAQEMPAVLRCLKSIAIHLHDIFFGPRKNEPGTPDQKFQALSGLELAMREGHRTNGDSRLRALRFVDFDGEQVDTTPHVKYGKAAPRLLRVHVGTHRRTRRLVIAWCGDHMETAGNNWIH